MATQILPTSAMKRCPKCGCEKSVVLFPRNRSKKDGYATWCRECHSAYNELHTKQKAESDATYRKANQERIAAQKAAYYRTNKCQIQAYWKSRKRTIDGFTSELWHRLNKRTVNGSHPQTANHHIVPYLNRGVELRMTKNELRAIVASNMSDIQAMWAAGQIPSIDRIDPNGHYSVDNVQFIPLSENCRKSAYETHVKLRAKRDLY